jgi:hypothetical protein
MVNIKFRLLRPSTYGTIFSFVFVSIFLLSLTNAYLHDSGEPELVLVFFGFPTSWLFISISGPFLNWLGPYGSMARDIGEWSVLGIAGILQYWLVGFVAANIVIKNWQTN